MSKPIATSSAKAALRRTLATLPALAGAALFSLAAHAATIAVDTAGDAGGGCTLRYALDNANAAGIVHAECGTGDAGSNTIAFVTALDGTPIALSAANGPLAIARSLTIQGNGANKTIIDGGDALRIFDLAPGAGVTVVLSALTAQNGAALGAAGDRIRDGGALWIGAGATVNILDCVFANNKAAGSGGAIWVNAPSAVLTIDRSTFASNTATATGGAIRNAGQLSIATSTFSANQARWGGGLYNSVPAGAEARIANSTFTANQAIYQTGSGNFGGAIVNDINVPAASGGSGNVFLTHVTIARNDATSGMGGGIFNGTTAGLAAIDPSGVITIDHSLLAANTADAGSDCATGTGSGVVSADYNVLSTVTGCAILGTTTHNVAGATASDLGALADNGGPTKTIAPNTGNAAIDIAPTCAVGVTTDQRGVARPQGTLCDSGAYETITGLAIAPSTLPNPRVGTAYLATLGASNGTAPYTFAVTSGALPTGLTLSAAGQLSGTPTAGGNFSFTVTATDNASLTGNASYTVTVGAPTISITPSSLPDATAGSAYSQSLAASGGTAPYTFAISSGALPSGVTLAANGTLSGAASTSGTYTFGVRATDSSTGTGPFAAVQTYTWTVRPSAPTKLQFVQQPANTTSGGTISPAVTVQILDAQGNATTSTASVTLAFGNNPGGGTLGGTVTVAAVNGLATFANLSVAKAGSGYTLDASASGLTGDTSSAFDVSPGAPAKLQFVQQPGNAISGAAISPAVTVRILDANDNPTASTATVSLALGSNPGGGALAGTVAVAAVGGVASFANLSIDKAGTGYTIAASTAGLAGAGSSPFDITAGPAAKLAFLQQPANATGGATLTPAVTVQIVDAAGNLTTSTANVVLSLGANPGGATLGGTLTATATNGTATFANLTVDKIGTGYTLAAQSTGLAGTTSTPFDITVGTAAKLIFEQQPTSTTGGAVIAPAVKVRITDAGGNLTASTANVTLGLGANPGSGTLGGTLTVAAVNGIATFANLSVDKVGTGYTLTATSGVLTASSAAFNVALGSPTTLRFGQQPGNATPATAMSPAVKVEIVDAGGNLTASTANVTLALGVNPAGGTLSGTLTVAAVSGTATFANLSIDKVGAGYTLAAQSTGLAAATSNAFDVTIGAPAKLVFVQQPGNITGGATITPAVKIDIVDAGGNLTASTANVTLGLGANPGNGTLGGTLTVAAVNGTATFANLTVDKIGTGYTLAATSGAIKAASAAFNVTLGAPAKLQFLQQPGNTGPNALMSPPVTVRIVDAGGNLTASTADVTLAIGTNPAAGKLSGTLTAAAVNGIARFANLSIDKAGTGYTLTAASAGLTSATSADFDISAAVPTLSGTGFVLLLATLALFGALGRRTASKRDIQP